MREGFEPATSGYEISAAVRWILPGSSDGLPLQIAVLGVRLKSLALVALPLPINSPGRGCNQTASAFTVHSISYLPDGGLRSSDTSFERRCYADQRPAARGTWRFRAGDDVPLAPWMVPGPRPRSMCREEPGALPASIVPPSATTVPAAPRPDRRRAALLPAEGLPAGRGRPGPARHTRAPTFCAAPAVPTSSAAGRATAASTHAPARTVYSADRATTCSSAGPAATSSTADQVARTVSWRAPATASAPANAGWHGARE